MQGWDPAAYRVDVTIEQAAFTNRVHVCIEIYGHYRFWKGIIAFHG